jgi:hypothetical protein
VLSFLGVFTTDKADQLRAQLTKALTEIISQVVADTELKTGYNKPGLLFNTFRESFVEIFQGTSGAYAALQGLDMGTSHLFRCMQVANGLIR